MLDQAKETVAERSSKLNYSVAGASRTTKERYLAKQNQRTERKNARRNEIQSAMVQTEREISTRRSARLQRMSEPVLKTASELEARRHRRHQEQERVQRQHRNPKSYELLACVHANTATAARL